MNKEKIIWTIGHSTRSAEDFLGLLKSVPIQLLADVRAFPGSRKYPHFNRETLSEAMKVNQIEYYHFATLGGRRKPRVDSKNSAWRNASFRGYADYMETPAFKEAILDLEKLAATKPTAYMCSESVWWKCHRALISDFLKVRGWSVLHIMDAGKTTEHPFTSPAQATQGELFY
jgi:uncharacterized protein (DUF488 family)